MLLHHDQQGLGFASVVVTVLCLQRLLQTVERIALSPLLKGLGKANLLIFFVVIVGVNVFAGVPIAFSFALATFGYLADVFVLPAHRGHGHGRTLVAAMLAHPQLQGLRRLMLATSDAHGLYAGFGFEAAGPGKLMEIVHPDPYRAAPAAA